jgi:pilus assembly protein Flp/PilA
MLPLTALFALFVAPYVRARYGRTERGASLVEYVLLLMLIALVCLASVAWFGGSNRNEYNDVGSTIS